MGASACSSRATRLLLIDLLPPVGHLVPDDGADVLYDHGVLLQVLGSVQTQPLDAGPGQVHVVLPLRLEATVLRGLGVHKLLAVGCVDLPGEGALVGFGHAGAVEGVRSGEEVKREKSGRQKKKRQEKNGFYIWKYN